MPCTVGELPGRPSPWRAERLQATRATTVAKSYRLLKAIMETATDDELIRRNPCRIKGAGTKKAKERPTATVEQVDALADALGPRWRLMVYFGAYGPMRPEEQAALRRPNVTLDPVAVKICEVLGEGRADLPALRRRPSAGGRRRHGCHGACRTRQDGAPTTDCTGT